MSDENEVEEDDPTKLPEGAVVIPAEDDDSYTADQAGSAPDADTMEQLHKAAWEAAEEAQKEGLI